MFTINYNSIEFLGAVQRDSVKADIDQNLTKHKDDGLPLTDIFQQSTLSETVARLALRHEDKLNQLWESLNVKAREDCIYQVPPDEPQIRNGYFLRAILFDPFYQNSILPSTDAILEIDPSNFGDSLAQKIEPHLKISDYELRKLSRGAQKKQINTVPLLTQLVRRPNCTPRDLLKLVSNSFQGLMNSDILRYREIWEKYPEGMKELYCIDKPQYYGYATLPIYFSEMASAYDKLVNKRGVIPENKSNYFPTFIEWLNAKAKLLPQTLELKHYGLPEILKTLTYARSNIDPRLNFSQDAIGEGRIMQDGRIIHPKKGK